MGALRSEGVVPTVVTGWDVSLLRKIFNVIVGLISVPAFWVLTVRCAWPITLDMIVVIALTELNRFFNEGRRIALYEQGVSPNNDAESKNLDLELEPPKSRLDCMAAVVGWREDPALFTRALESYKSAIGCDFLLVGIDGDEADDQDMVDVFNSVYPANSKVVHIAEPLGEIAEQVVLQEISKCQQAGREVDQEKCHEIALRHCIDLAVKVLEQEDITFSGKRQIKQLCLRQRHLHKKGIMFTTFIFSIVIADILGVEFLWSSDSDTLVLPQSIEQSVNCVAADPKIGGASTGLIIHNQEETAITRLSATVYWSELYLTRSSTAVTATSDCQSGPSTLFRVSALPCILVPWYGQSILGKRMIINEDRHLTTNLLARGWGVVFSSDVLTATDTPTTLSRWLKQQVRWGRATHVEAIFHPQVYVKHNPLLFFSMAKREVWPLIIATAVVCYIFTDKQLIHFSFGDMVLRNFVGVGYNMLRNPQRLSLASYCWVIPGMFFYHFPLPAVHFWSLVTLTADGWGTSMRSSGERARREGVRQAWWETGFFTVWMALAGAAFSKWVAINLSIQEEYMTVAICSGALLASFTTWKATISGA
ncbi:glycosyltransferase family 2 protein [Ilyonectria destructans]|nr:glycosyltransferase family 2 protein [Ilyonectria destructans]